MIHSRKTFLGCGLAFQQPFRYFKIFKHMSIPLHPSRIPACPRFGCLLRHFSGAWHLSSPFGHHGDRFDSSRFADPAQRTEKVPLFGALDLAHHGDGHLSLPPTCHGVDVLVEPGRCAGRRDGPPPHEEALIEMPGG